MNNMTNSKKNNQVDIHKEFDQGERLSIFLRTVQAGHEVAYRERDNALNKGKNNNIIKYSWADNQTIHKENVDDDFGVTQVLSYTGLVKTVNNEKEYHMVDISFGEVYEIVQEMPNELFVQFESVLRCDYSSNENDETDNCDSVLDNVHPIKNVEDIRANTGEDVNGESCTNKDLDDSVKDLPCPVCIQLSALGNHDIFCPVCTMFQMHNSPFNQGEDKSAKSKQDTSEDVSEDKPTCPVCVLNSLNYNPDVACPLCTMLNLKAKQNNVDIDSELGEQEHDTQLDVHGIIRDTLQAINQISQVMPQNASGEKNKANSNEPNPEEMREAFVGFINSLSVLDELKGTFS